MMSGGYAGPRPSPRAPGPSPTPSAATPAAATPAAGPTALPTASAVATPTPAAPLALSPAALYQQDCAVCHGVDRNGGRGPALLPSTLNDSTAYYVSAVEYGVVGTLMPGWLSQGLTDAQIRALVAYLQYTPASP